MKIVGVPGSVRSNSFNRAFLKWIKTVVEPLGASMEVVDISNIPVVIGERVELTSEVIQIKKTIAGAEGVIFSTPQYNYSFTHALKNTIDWVAFPENDNSWTGKKAYVVGVSMVSSGVLKAEEKLKAYLKNLGMVIFPGESITIDRAGEKEVFDNSGGLIDKELEEMSKKLLKEFVAWL